MEYKAIKALNERSKTINRASGMIFINSIKLVKKEELDSSILEDYTEESVEAIPNEVFLCDYDDKWSLSFCTERVLLSELMTGLICCELWIANVEMLNRTDILPRIDILPTYTPIRMIYSQDDRMARVFVGNVAVSVFCISELMSKTAIQDIYGKTLHNLRSYGLITLSIEDTLKKEIEKSITYIRLETNGVMFGTDKNNRYRIQM